MGLAESLKANQGKLDREVVFFQAAKFSSAVPVRRSRSMWTQTLCVNTNPPSPPPHFCFPLFIKFSNSRYVILISWNNAWTLISTGSSSIGTIKLDSNGRIFLPSNISRQKFLCQNGAADMTRLSFTKSFSSLARRCWILLLGKKLLPDPIFPDSLLSFLLSPFGGRGIDIPEIFCVKKICCSYCYRKWMARGGRAMVLGGNGNDPRIVRGYRGWSYKRLLGYRR